MAYMQTFDMSLGGENEVSDKVCVSTRNGTQTHSFTSHMHTHMFDEAHANVNNTQKFRQELEAFR